MSNAIFGIDVGKSKLSLALIANEKTTYKTVSNDLNGFKRIVSFVQKKAGKAEVYLESTGCYWEALTEFLYAHGFSIKVKNPIQINAFVKMKMARHKTNKVDAGIIAEYGAKFGGVLYAPTAENVKKHSGMLPRRFSS